jgi:hypothetical protein
MVGFFYVYFCQYFTPHTSLSTQFGILPECMGGEFLKDLGVG